MDILQYVKYVFIVIDIIVLLTLVINLLKGFFQGFFRYLFTSGLKWIIIVILILFSKQIAQELLTIDIPQIGRLDNYLVSVICDLMKMDQSTLVNTYTYELIYTVVLSTIRLSVILISVFLTNLIIWPIISLVLTIFGINALIKKLPKSLTHRILGLVLSIVVFLVIFVVTYLPYYGLINLATYGLEDSKLIVSNEPQIEEVSELKMEYTTKLSVLNNIDEILQSLEGLCINDFLNKFETHPGEMYLDYIYVIETNGDEIHLIEEYKNLRPLITLIGTTFNKDGFNIENLSLTSDEFNTMIDVVKNTKVFDTFLPVIVEVAISTGSFDKYNLGLEIGNIQDLDWQAEFNQIDVVLDSFKGLYVELSEYKDDFKKFLADEDFENTVSSVIEALVDLELVKEYGLTIADFELDKYVAENPDGDFTPILSALEIKEVLTKDIRKTCILLQNIYKLGFIDQSRTPDFNNQEDYELLDNLVNTAFDLSFIEGNEVNLIEMLLDTFDLKTTLDEFGIVIETEDVDWDTEPSALVSLFVEILSVEDLGSILSEFSDENKEKLSNILHAFIKTQTIRKSIPVLVEKFLDEAALSQYKSNWLIEQKDSFVEAEWELEIDNLVNVITKFSTESLDFENISNENLSSIKEVLLDITKIKSLTLNPIVDILNDVLSDTVGTDKNYLSIPNDINWSDEINIIFGDDGIYYNFKNITESTGYAKYGKMLDTMLESKIFASGFYDFINDYIKTLSIYKTTENPNGILTESDINIDNLRLVESWEKELGLIDEIDLNSDLQSGEVLDKIMQSVLLKRQIKEYIINIIKDNNLEEYYSVSDIENDIDAVNEKIELTKADNDPTNDYSWAKEVENIQKFNVTLTDLIMNISDPSVLNAKANELKIISESGVITARMLANVKTKYPVLNGII